MARMALGRLYRRKASYLHASEEFLARGKRQFDRLYAESASITRIMSISVHPSLTGAPHRIGYLYELLDHIRQKDDVAFWTGEEILDWYRPLVI